MRRRLGTDPTYPKQLMGSRARSGWGGTICFTQGEATLPFLREESMSSLTVLKVLGRARSGKARGIRQRTRRPAPRHRGAEQSGTPRSQLIRGAPAEAPPLAPPPRLGRDHRAASGGVSARGGGGAAIVRSAQPRGEGRELRSQPGPGASQPAAATPQPAGAPGSSPAGPELASSAARNSAVAGERRRERLRTPGLARPHGPAPPPQLPSLSCRVPPLSSGRVVLPASS